MSYETLFQRYGSPSREAEINIRGYLVKPDKLTQERIRGFDNSAAGIIARCEETIEALQDYRRALAARYAELESAPYTLRLELERKPSYSGSGVLYYVRIIREYQDGTEVQELAETYQGKQRPGIEIMKDIEKRQWER